MTDVPLFLKAFPFQQDVLALPVADVEIVTHWYQRSFGLVEVRRAEAPHKTVIMQRDGVEIGFSENGGDSEQDGAAILISDIARARAEFQANGLEIGEGRIDERDGVKYQVFFVVAPDGLCYYFHQPLSKQSKA